MRPGFFYFLLYRGTRSARGAARNFFSSAGSRSMSKICSAARLARPRDRDLNVSLYPQVECSCESPHTQRDHFNNGIFDCLNSTSDFFSYRFGKLRKNCLRNWSKKIETAN